MNPQAAKTTTTVIDGATTTEITTEPATIEMTLATSLQELIEKENLPTVILDNLKTYITDTNSKLGGPTDQDRKKIFPLNPK